MTIGKRVWLLSACLVMMCLTMGVASLIGLSGIDKSLGELANDSVPGLVGTANIASAFYRFRGDAWKHIASASSEHIGAAESDMENLKRDMEQQLNKYEVTIHDAEDRANFTEIRNALGRFYQAWENDVRPLSRENKNHEAYLVYMKSVDPIFHELSDSISKVLRWNAEHGRASGAAANSSAGTARFITGSLPCICLIAAALLSFFLLRGVNTALRRAVSELSESATQVTGAAAEIAASSQSLAQGSSEQAASLEETLRRARKSILWPAGTLKIRAMPRNSSRGPNRNSVRPISP
ncbi:MAG: MCP four helix bundle domain-containing protein [Bryobacteraceae bacterium]